MEVSEHPFRVLMAADAVGGVWQYSMSLCRGLARHGCEVLLAVMGSAPSDRQCAEALTIPGLRLELLGGALEWTERPWDDVDASGRKLLGLGREFSPDLVHLNGYSHAALPFQCPAIAVAHSCVPSWWRAVHGSDAPHEWDEYRQRVRIGLRFASAVIAPSRTMAKALGREYGWREQQTVVIFNGADGRAAMPPRKEKWCLAAGRLWDRGKNIGVLHQAAESFPGKICVAGDGGQATPGSKWQLLGRLDHEDVLTHMERAAVFAHPALYEPFGLTVLEAAGRGCALILSDIPSLRELWDGAAHFVPPRDGAAWAAAIGALLESDGERLQLGQAALERARTYRNERFVQSYLQLYRQQAAKRDSVAS